MNTQPTSGLVGVGLYTPAEASRLLGIGRGRLVRWLRGHTIGVTDYPRLWRAQVELDDGKIYLGFRDLMEARIANLFISAGLSPIKVRRAILVAQEMTGDERPLSTSWLKTDGRTVFLDVVADDGSTSLVDLFRNQFAFREMVAPSFKDVDFDDAGIPERWWPIGKRGGIVVDPRRSFGRPIEATTSVPAAVLAAAATAEGSAARAAGAWSVPEAAVMRAVTYMAALDRKAA